MNGFIDGFEIKEVILTEEQKHAIRNIGDCELDGFTTEEETELGES